MPNRVLALDVGASTLRAALVESSLRSHRVLGLYAQPRTNGDLGADVRALTERHRLTWDEVVTALPGDAVTHRILTLPFADRKRLDQTVPFELEAQLPFEVEDAVVDYQVLDSTDGTTRVLAAVAPKARVRAQLEQLDAAGLDPRLLDLVPLAPLNLLRLGGASGPAALLTIDRERTTVALLDGAHLLGIRSLPAGSESGDPEGLVRDVRWSLLALADSHALADGALWLAGDGAGAPGLVAALGRALGTTPRSLDTLEIAAVPDGLRREQAPFAVPLGLALRETADAPFGLDFRRGEFAYHREREALWRAAATSGVLAAVALVLAVASWALDARALGARRDAVRAQIRQLFLGALPGARTIVNEKAQLQSEIAALEKQRRAYGSLAPSAPRAIDLMRALTLAVPGDVKLDVEELSLDGETLRLRGSTASYEAVEAVKRRLEERPEFTDVQTRDVRASVDGQRVDFRLSLVLAGTEAPT